MTNIYINVRREAIKKAKTEIEINMILEKIYDDGFNDGIGACKEELENLKSELNLNSR